MKILAKDPSLSLEREDSLGNEISLLFQALVSPRARNRADGDCLLNFVGWEEARVCFVGSAMV